MMPMSASCKHRCLSKSYPWSGAERLSILFGVIITLASLLGGFMALGGHLSVIWQPWEFVIIAGMALGIYIIANPWKTVARHGCRDDTGDYWGCSEAAPLSGPVGCFCTP